MSRASIAKMRFCGKIHLSYTLIEAELCVASRQNSLFELWNSTRNRSIRAILNLSLGAMDSNLLFQD
jgi:hypothetical protein